MTEEMRQAAIFQIKIDEGFSLKSYQDSLGIWTIGFGRNLQNMTISYNLAESFLAEDISWHLAQLQNTYQWFNSLNEVRQQVLLNMSFNLGFKGLQGFTKMLAACSTGCFSTASAEMLNSLWAKQVGDRAVRLAKEMATGIKVCS